MNVNEAFRNARQAELLLATHTKIRR
jgi:hypothetical protein